MTLEELTNYHLLPCDEACPIVGAGQACGLPEPWEIIAMLDRKEVWTCHSNPNKPCCVTNLKEFPEGYKAITEVEYNNPNYLPL